MQQGDSGFKAETLEADREQKTITNALLQGVNMFIKKFNFVLI